jgi:hypothetical protein
MALMSNVSTSMEDFIGQLRAVVTKVAPGTSLEKLIEAEKAEAAGRREGAPPGGAVHGEADAGAGDGVDDVGDDLGPEWAADLTSSFVAMQERLAKLDLHVSEPGA